MTTTDKCPFCDIDRSKRIYENDLSVAIYDGYPVNEGHTLVIPKRHVANYFELTAEEKESIWAAIEECKKVLDTTFHPDGYNIGINIGEDAGQSIPHVHVHLIPRYHGDVSNPRGGVRGVIPGKQNY